MTTDHVSDIDTGARERFARRLRSVRARCDKTLRELQAATFASDSALSRYLAGRAVPPWKVVAALCEQAGIDPAELRPLWQLARSTRPRKPVPTPPLLELHAVADHLSRISSEVTRAIREVRARGEQVPEHLLRVQRCGSDAAIRLRAAQRLISSS